ncbi:MAG: ATP-binding cassette domain-containing protein [Acidobacteriaceae bacterium]|nr:ATP-binding cassette domain-containing protein [Acidobacteriaceae bacterium]
MDCGPAALKCLLEGFGIPISYGRLREACQTGVDGTCIDTLETVAKQLGLEAEQIMIPADHLLVPEANALPAIVVVNLPGGLTHFVVVWRRHGRMLQVMDPAIGRRWVPAKQFLAEIYSHTMPASAKDWRDYAASEDFQSVLGARLHRLGLNRMVQNRLLSDVLNDESWRSIAVLDASARLLRLLCDAGAVRGGRDVLALIERFRSEPEKIPQHCWSVRTAPQDSEGCEQILLRGAVLVCVRGTGPIASRAELGSELAAALAEHPFRPSRELWRALRQSSRLTPVLVFFTLIVAAGGTIVEALLFRALLDVTAQLRISGQRMAAIGAVILFSLILLLMEFPLFSAALRLGRQIENRLRVAFLEKIPKLGDRYFQSRLTSDMAERSHAAQRLRDLPNAARQALRALFEMFAMAAGIVWLEPSAAPFVIVILAAAVIPAFVSQPLLAERDLRVRSHAAGLTRFYLDAMLGLLAIRAHGGERAVRREHEKLLGEWASASVRLQRGVVAAEAVQLTGMFGLIAALMLLHPLQGAAVGRLLLLVYWALNLPVLGQEFGTLTRQYPAYRNLTLRLLEPLGAPEESSNIDRSDERSAPGAPALEFRDVSVEVAGHTILDAINMNIAPASHIAIVGPSGAGKSSLVGILLGWLKPSKGEVLAGGAPLDPDQLRRSVAWVDPAVQLWNRSLVDNLSYGSAPDPASVAQAIDEAMLRGVLETLPSGLQTKLGESGGLVSGGEGQRVRLARALLRQNTRLVILDEPFRGLDREKRSELLLRARRLWCHATLLCITHDVAETQSFDRVLVIERGRLIEHGTPRELAANRASRYSQLLEAEKQTRTGLWSGGFWRRIRVHSGRLIEELPASAGVAEAEEVA